MIKWLYVTLVEKDLILWRKILEEFTIINNFERKLCTFIGSTVNILHKQTTICSEGVKNKTRNLYQTLFISGPPVAISHSQSIKDLDNLKCILE